MGAFKVKKNGVVYENNKMPGAYPAERVTYDNTESGLTANSAQGAIDEVVEIKANKTDLTNISQSGTTATQAISSGTFFYLNGTLVRAKTAIASGATFTLNTNYEVVTIGGRVTSVEGAIDGLINGGLKMFAGTGSISVAPQSDRTSSLTIEDIKQASGFTTIYHILCNFKGNGSGTPALLWYSGSDSKFHSYGVYSGGTYNNVGFSYVAFGN